jgi:hypothetical protein
MPFRVNIILCISLFVLFLSMGIFISSRKPLWNDESYSQANTISKGTYPQIIFSGIQGEGNKSPLFYLQQKMLCDTFHYKSTAVRDSKFERIFLRIPTVLEISLFLTMLFYFFSRRFNLWFGFLGVFTALSSLMLWWYWAEARPYGLWVLLTACQMFLFIDITENPLVSRRHWIWLGMVHILLALTCVLSVIQVTVISAIILFQKPHWKKFIFLLLIPLLLAAYYKPTGPANNVIFTMTVDQLLRDNMARDRLYVLLFYPFLLLLCFILSKLHLKVHRDDLIVKSFPFFLAVFSTILTTVLFLAYLRDHALNQGQYVVSRHIIFLLPVGIIAVTYLAGIVWESFKGISWMRIVPIVGILILLSYRMERIISGIKHFLLGFHT